MEAVGVRRSTPVNTVRMTLAELSSLCSLERQMVVDELTAREWKWEEVYGCGCGCERIG